MVSGWLMSLPSQPVDGAAQVGGEIFAIKPGDSAPTQWTHLTAIYGAERINGVAVGELSWSPDSTRIAFWVTAITGADVTANLGTSVIHILDVNTGELKRLLRLRDDRANAQPAAPDLVAGRHAHWLSAARFPAITRAITCWRWIRPAARSPR